MALGTRDRSSTSAPLVWVVGQHLARPTDQPGRGLVPGAGHHREVREELFAAQAGRCRSRPRTRR